MENYQQYQCIHKVFEAQAAKTPEAIAIKFKDHHITYQELNERANQLAHYLKVMGVGPEVPVGIYMDHSLEMVVGLYAILKTGGAYIPLDPIHPAHQMTFTIIDTNMPVLLTQSHLRPKLTTFDAQVICIDSDWPKLAAHFSSKNPNETVEADNLAYIFYIPEIKTVRPKGIMNAHQTLYHHLIGLQEMSPLTETDIVIQKTAVSHGAMAWEIFWPLMTGAQIVIAQPQACEDPTYLIELIREEQITTIHFSPSMLQVFLQTPMVEEVNAFLKRVLCSGEPLSTSLQQHYFSRLEAPLYHLYHPPEAGIELVDQIQQQDKTALIGTSANLEIHILDEDFRAVPSGTIGEIYIGGTGVARGFFRLPALTAEHFVPNPFQAGARLYKTGDKGRYLPDGNIEYLAQAQPEPSSLASISETPAPIKEMDSLETLIDQPSITISQEELLHIWAEAFGIETVHREDDFFELGGDSLIAAQIAFRIWKHFQIDLPPTALFETTTPADLLARLEQSQPQSSQRPPLRPVDRDQKLPLSIVQREIWLFCKVTPKSPFYNLPIAIRFNGALDASVLEQCLNEIVRHHEALRTVFRIENEQPVQHILPELFVPIKKQDLQNLSPKIREAEVQRLINAEAQRPIEALDEAPLFYPTLFKLSADEHIFLLIFHHIVMDQWSVGLFMRELQQRYEAHLSGKGLTLSQSPIQQVDFAFWQQQWHYEQILTNQLFYWKQQMAGLKPGPIQWPFDYSRPPVPAHRGGIKPFTIPKAVIHHLKKLSREENVTLYISLLATFKALLYRYTEQADIIVGAPFSNRSRTELEHILGMVSNNLPLRTDFSSNPTFRELLGIVREITLAACVNQDLPLKILISQLKLPRDLSYIPLFQTMFIFAPALEDSSFVHFDKEIELTASQVMVHNGSARMDLSLYLYPQGETISGWFEYDSSLFDEPTISYLLKIYQTLLVSLANQPDERLMNISILTEKQVIEDTYALSPMQQEMVRYMQEKETNEIDVYTKQVVINLHESLNVHAFFQSWQEIVARHSILRTSVQTKDMKQSIHHQIKIPWIQQDWRGFSPAHQETLYQNYLATDREQSFDLEHPPLVRIALFRLGEANYRCIWSFHHTILDRRSFAIILQELFNFYEVLCHDRAWLPPPARPYQDFIDWLKQQKVEESRDFWQQLLKGFTEPTPLPTAYPEQNRSEYDKQKIRLSKQVTSVLTRLAEQHHLTLNTLLQGAWAILLSYYSGQYDIVFGAKRSGRYTTITEPQSRVGMFINTLPLRVQLKPKVPLIQWLQALRTQFISIRDYEHTALSQIEQWSEIVPNTPLFHSLIKFENAPLINLLQAQDPKWQEREIQIFERTNYPLTLIGYTDNELLLTLEYDLSYFDPASISRILKHLRNLLNGMATKGLAQTMADLPLLTNVERRQMLVEWNRTQQNFPQNRCIHHLFEMQVEKTPQAIAINHEGQTLTYQELNQRANQLAHHLQSLGVGSETNVGLYLHRSPEMLVGMLGILKAGGAYIPLNPDYPAERLLLMLSDSQASILITQARLTLPDYSGETIKLDAEWSKISIQKTTNPTSSVTPYNLACLLYTSGSTGQPKGVMIEHQSLVNFTHAVSKAYGITAKDKVLQFAPLNYDASITEIYPGLSQGATLLLRTKEMTNSPHLFLKQCRQWEVTVVNLPTAYWHQFVMSRLDIPASLRLIIIGDEKVQPKAVKNWFEYAPPTVRLVNSYGLTESTVGAILCDLKADDIKGSTTIPIGRPITNMKAYVLNQDLNPVPIGVIGELYLSGVGLARGYFNQPELTAEKFIAHPFNKGPEARLFKTGDLVRYLPDGNLEFIDHLDHRAKIRGFHIELGEVETILSQHPAVQEAVSLARRDQYGQNRLVAYVVPELSSTLTIGQLRYYLKRKLPDYMIPSAFVLLDKIPLTAHGKIDYEALPELDEVIIEEPTETLKKPQDAVEQKLIEIWQEVLEQPKIGIQDNFFELNGHSLLVLRLFAQIEEAFEVKLPPALLFQMPTIEKLAEVIRQEKPLPTESAAIQLRTGTYKTPFFCLPDNLGNVFTDLGKLAQYIGSNQPFYGLQDCVDYPSKIEVIAAHYLKEIGQIQGQGPYLLGGIGSGSVIVYEMAQQLQAQGKTVAVLALIEPTLPRENVSLRNYISTAATIFNQFLRRFGLHTRNMAHLDTEEKEVYMRLRTKLVSNLWGLAGYAPKPYPGHVHLFLTSKSLNQQGDQSALNWQVLAQKGATIHQLPGTPKMITSQQNKKVSTGAIKSLAQQLRECIDKALNQ